jgi:hypothetical protein
VYLCRRVQERISKLGGCRGVERPDAARLHRVKNGFRLVCQKLLVQQD